MSEGTSKNEDIFESLAEMCLYVLYETCAGVMEFRKKDAQVNIFQFTRPVWTSFKIAVRCKLLTHN